MEISHWLDPEGSTTALDFTVPVAVGETKTLNIYATYEQVHYVFFMDNVGRVIATKEGKTGEIISTADVTFVTDTTTAVTGWSLQEAAPQTPVGNGVRLENADIVLYPIVSEAYWVTYESGNDATYYAPRYVMPGGKAENPGKPTRLGYTFQHWSLSEDGGAYNFSSNVSGNITLYAVWKAQTVNYSVVYWYEKPNIAEDAGTDVSNYMFNKSETRSALAGSYVSASTLSRRDSIEYGYFSHGDEQLLVKGDGTTVLNVYFKRIVYTIEFNLNGGSMQFNGNEEVYTSSKILTCTKEEHEHNRWCGWGKYCYKEEHEHNDSCYFLANPYSFTAKYEQDIQNQWPSSKNATFTKGQDGFINWNGNLASHRVTLNKELIKPDSNNVITFTANWAKTRNAKVNYWFEEIASGIPEGERKTYKGKTYVKSEVYSQDITLQSSVGLTPKDIDGVYNIGDDGTDKSEKVYNFYYDRYKFDLKFNSMGQESR